ncbi:MAG: diaminopimelate epimerase [Proteobacteria bacterium]|nr:diaminopimelate epimerase [Pseudomonadota bacterium]MBU1581674.1 diaminopimelate epimerase [Pseudomonadota bacterium]MBU2454683.1 diaminopimelate epimerase [Pseudomonadota bacterium]MBU2628612.1 diaminopimelate epimerase [Pseudomonadota bacterium]
MELEFVKMEGLGNDFILIDDRNNHIEQYMSYPELSKKLCSRHFGIGADGIILILDALDHDIKFRIYNSDGSQAQMCGNGMRCFAKYLYENKIMKPKKIRVDTKAGTVIPEVIVNERGQVCSVRVDMGEPVLFCKDIPFESPNEKAIEERLTVGGKVYQMTALSMGNPHAVLFVDDVEAIDIETIGRSIETHERFPEKTNVEFIEVLNNRELKMKVWERGAGITLACGTGACAALVAANLTGRVQDNAVVHLDGGDLDIHWDKETNHVFKTGPANLVFEGRIRI